ncbi:MAG: hypothetical protein Kow0074_12640 [Candidatus Zixiibacteriota bacterium]
MNSIIRQMTVMMAALAVVWSATGVSAQDDLHDKVTAYLVPGGASESAVLELWMSNVNNVLALCLPFKFAAGDSLIFDSLVTRGGRAQDFAIVKPVFRPENQTLLINLMWAKDTTYEAPPIPPGSGPLMRVYLSTPYPFPMKDFQMASVQLPPQNVLMFVTESLNSVTPDFEFSREAPPGPWGGTAQSPKTDGPK